MKTLIIALLSFALISCKSVAEPKAIHNNLSQDIIETIKAYENSRGAGTVILTKFIHPDYRDAEFFDTKSVEELHGIKVDSGPMNLRWAFGTKQMFDGHEVTFVRYYMESRNRSVFGQELILQDDKNNVYFIPREFWELNFRPTDQSAEAKELRRLIR